MEPIEIDIRMNQNVSDESGKASQAMEQMEQRSRELEAQIAAQKKVIADLESGYSRANDAADMSAHKIDALTGVIERQKAEIASQKKALADLQAQYANVNKAIDDTGQSAGKTSSAISASTSELREQVDIQKKVIADMEAQYVKAKADFDRLNISTADAGASAQKSQASKIFHEIRTELDLEKKALVEIEKELSKQEQALKKADSSAQSYMSQMRKIREEMLQMRGRGINSPEEIQRYGELQSNLTDLTRQYKIVNKERALLASPGAQFTGIIQGLGAVAGAFSAAQGIASLFTSDAAKMAAIQTKLQSAIAITTGLQGIHNATLATSAFRMVTVKKATELWNGAVKALNVNLGISVGLSKALMIGGIGLLIAGVALLVSKYKEMNEQKKETARLNRIVTDSLKEAGLEGEKAARKESTQLDILYKASQNETKSKKERLDAIRKLQQDYPAYFGNLTQEQILAGKASDAYILLSNNILKAAKARAYADRITENETKKLELEDQRTQALADKESVFVKRDRVKNDLLNGNFTSSQSAAAQADFIEREKELVSLHNKKIWDITKEIGKLDEANRELADNINVTDLIFDLKLDKKDPKVPDDAAKMMETRREALRKLQESEEKRKQEQLDFDNDMRQKEIEVMQTGYDKELAVLQLNLDRQSQAVAAFRLKMARDQEREAENLYVAEHGNKNGFEKWFANANLSEIMPDGLKPADIESQAEQMTQSAREIYNKGYADINRDIARAMEEQAMQLAPELDKQLYAIKRHFDDLRMTVEEGSSEWQALNNIQAHEEEYAREQHNTRLVGLLNDYLQESSELATKNYIFQADRDAALLRVQIENSEKLIAQKKREFEALTGQNYDAMDEAMLSAMENLYPEIVAEIKKMKLEQKSYNEELKKTPAKKLQELAGHISDVSNTLTSTLGDFGIEFSENVQKAIDGIGQSIDGLASMDVTKPISIITGAMKALGGLAKAAFGIFGGADYSEYDELKSKYDNLLNIWNELIDKKKEYLSTSAADEVKRIERETLDLINKQTEAVRKLAEARLNSGSSVGSHSLWYRMWKGENKFDGKTWRDVAGDISKELGVPFTEMSDMLNMTADQLQWIKENYSGLWAVMDGDFRGYLEQLIDYGDAAKEAINAAKEAATGITFDTLSDNFLNTLADMSSSAEDFANDFSGYLQKAILKAMIDKLYADKLQKFYDNFAEYNSNDGQIDNSEYSRLQNQWKEIVDGALSERDRLMGIFNWGNEQERSATSKGIASMSQDSANELNGNFYAIRQQVGDIRNLQKEANIQRAAIYTALSRVVENTEFCRLLSDVKNSLEDMQTRGIKVKV